MDEALARWLVGPQGADALRLASEQADPSSLAAATALRRHWRPDQAAAALQQAALRRRGRTKFGDLAQALFLTAAGLEQATRAEVARWRAGRFAAAGVSRVVDLGCGVGADALAFLQAGLEVVAVEFDPVTAVFAAANLQSALGRAAVQRGDAQQVAGELLRPDDAVFLDPARRSSRGRSWRVEDLSPPWEFALSLLANRTGAIKAAPGIAHTAIPPDLAATWVSHRGDLVETSLWSGAWEPGARVATLLPAGDELTIPRIPHEAAIGGIGAYLYEPDPAVIRAGGASQLATLLDGWRVAAGIAYLSSDTLVDTPFATGFEVLEVLPFDERVLRAWMRGHDIGTLEIKVRGLDVDPAALRKRLKPVGTGSATLVVTPTGAGARAVVVRRSQGPE